MEEPSSVLVLGDVNDDKSVTAEDALLALQAATKKVNLTDVQELAADVDGIAGVSSADALNILQYVTKKIDFFPVEGEDIPDTPDTPDVPDTPKPPVGGNTPGGIGSGDGVDDTLD